MTTTLFRPPRIDESFSSESLTRQQMDAYWREGWLRFGTTFSRHSYFCYEGQTWTIQPLRVRLGELVLSKSQRRTLRKNTDLAVRIGPAQLDDARCRLFNNHKRRFPEPNPDTLEGFIGAAPANCPCDTVEIVAYEDQKMIAASYLDIGHESASSIHASYDLAHLRRRLGICTMLWEIAYARERGCVYYYPGFAFHESSSMDYKKQFPAMEWYDWRGHWLPLRERAVEDTLESPSQLELLPAFV
jgi:arginine-tRNA-protein transferase